MITRGLWIRLEAKSDQGDEVEKFLQSTLPLVRQEMGTVAWFAAKIGRLDYAIFEAFADDMDRDAHLKGKAASLLQARTSDLFEIPPQIEAVEVLSSKLPVVPPSEVVRKGLWLSLQARNGHVHEMGEFIREGRVHVQEEPKTTAWFGLRLPDGAFAVVDFFPDNAARLAHLAGPLPRELTKHAEPLVGGPPDLEMLDVLAAKITVPIPV
jgi:quinol monooxygenase YgiN